MPDVQRDLTEIAGKGSRLHQKYKVYLDAVTVATPPESYEQRLVPMYPGAWVHLRLEALDWRLMIWLSQSLSGTLSAIVTTCSSLHERAT